MSMGGSAGQGSGGTAGAPGLHSYACQPVGSVPTDGIFSLRAFQGTLYAGLFGYGHETESMLFAHPPWARITPGLVGISESVCAMLEFQGRLYANTESDGDIFRSSDGRNWERVHDGASGVIGCGLEEFGGALYAVNFNFQTLSEGKILRSVDGAIWTTVYDSGATGLYLRHVVAHAGTLYALGTLDPGDQGKILSSTDGTSWAETNAPTRFFRALSHDGDLYLSSTTSRSNGAAGIWRLDGGAPTLVHPVSTTYVTELAAWDGALWAGTSDGWKEATGSSSLLLSRDGSSWETACTFSEAAAWAVAPLDDHLYVGTWEFGSGGRLYEVSIETASDGGAAVDCSAIDANPAWELCETTPTTCAGVYTDAAGCTAFCAAVGLSCTARFGGEPGCAKEPQNPIPCNEMNTHGSDWCECG